MRRGAEGAGERAGLGRKLAVQELLPRTAANPVSAGDGSVLPGSRTADSTLLPPFPPRSSIASLRPMTHPRRASNNVDHGLCPAVFPLR